MKILFSPSETKIKGGKNIKLDKNSFLFPNLFEKRMFAVEKYQNFIDASTNLQLTKLFGTKKQTVVDYYKGNLLEKKIMKVIERYAGVAYNYLKYFSLNKKEKNYIDKNVVIFSNLFGPILAGDIGIPEYKLKQNEKIGDFTIEKFYHKYFTDALDDYLKNDDILDLRAGFYEKFYKINKPYITMKFIKNGKVVSHWAKAYRGIVLRQIAKNNIQNFSDLINMEIKNLSVIEIKKYKFKEEISYNINNDII